VRTGLEYAVSHGTEVQCDDELDDDEKKENLCSCMGEVGKLVIEKVVEEGDLNNKGQNNKGHYIPGKNTLLGIPRWSLHNVRIRRRDP